MGLTQMVVQWWTDNGQQTTLSSLISKNPNLVFKRESSVSRFKWTAVIFTKVLAAEKALSQVHPNKQQARIWLCSRRAARHSDDRWQPQLQGIPTIARTGVCPNWLHRDEWLRSIREILEHLHYLDIPGESCNRWLTTSRAIKRLMD